MPTFKYKALDKDGKEKSGDINADNEKEARKKLRRDKLLPLNVTSINKPENNNVKNKSVLNIQLFSSSKNKLKVAELALFTRQLATLLSSGMPIDESLRALVDQQDNAKISRIVSVLLEKVQEGYSLSVSMSFFSEAFPQLYRSTINSGEKSGHLAAVLESLADYTDRQNTLTMKIKQAAIYPIVMVCLSVIILSFLLVFVVPKMSSVFADFDQKLPLITRIMLSISNFLVDYGVYFFAGIFILIFVFKYLILKNRAYKFKLHKILLKLPVIGNAIRTVNIARYARTFGMLFQAGVPVIDSMRVSSQVVSNLPMHDALYSAANEVQEGGTIFNALRETKFFPAIGLHLVSSGEKSGKLDFMLNKVADTQEQQVEGVITNVLSLFEPFIIVTMGGVVLMIVLSIMLPILQMNQLVGQA